MNADEARTDRRAWEKNYSAYAPDLPGCIATGETGETPEETYEHMREAIEIYLDELKCSGEPVPEPSADVDYVTV